MTLPFPDPRTAATLLALTSINMGALLWLLGRGHGSHHWRWMVAAAWLYAASTLLQNIALHNPWATGIAAPLQHLALASMGQALAGLQTPQSQPRKAPWWPLLWVLASGIAALAMPPASSAHFHTTQSVLLVLHGLVLCAAIAHQQYRTPCGGYANWLAVLLCIATQWLALALVHGQHPSTSSAPASALWLYWALQCTHVVALAALLLRLQQAQHTALTRDSARIDTLTQLPNRAALTHHLDNAIQQAAEQQQPLAVLVLDIDHFKSVNDSYGHLVGDQVIQHLARMLQRHGRSADFAARYGGEEFVVVLPAMAARSAFHYAESLCRAMRQAPLQLANGQTLHITISIGVYAGIPSHGSGWQRYVGLADEAMYVAKRNGRDRVAMSAALQSMPKPPMPLWDAPER